MSTTREELAAELGALLLREVGGGCTLAVRAHPGARRDAITGVHAGALKVSLTTAPEGGRANAALIALLAEALRLQRAQVTLVTGATSRAKTLRIAGVDAATVRAGLLAAMSS